MWILYTLLIHLVLLGSIFVIYFRSPVITGLQPQAKVTSYGLKPPAKRLVLIVTDGLRAESFFNGNCSDIPHLRNLMIQNGGLVGISHTHVPTESRPGHIALIAGLYEDPSAVTRGWKENPIDFDTVFNRSQHTYAWGANDVLHIFSRLNDGGRNEKHIFIDAYNSDLDFSGRDNTYDLDEWVFERVRMFLKRKRDDLLQQEQVVFFLHLLGLDTSGHVHKPGSQRFLDNLHRTEQSIVEIYKEFERTFPDKQTAYMLTSDHGMTDAGSHGAGAAYETETPFFLFGAGIANRAPNSGKTFNVGPNTQLPLYELEQAQFTPLMSALIGLAPPMNNFGTLPLGYLAVSAQYEAVAAHTNALQLLEQFRKLLNENQNVYLQGFLRSFKKLNMAGIESYKISFENLLANGAYRRAMELSKSTMYIALQGIDYYHGYYRNVLLACTMLTFTGWIYYLLQLLLVKDLMRRPRQHQQKTPWPFVCLVIVVLLIIGVQRVPFAIAFYLILPFIIWHLAMQKQRLHAAALRQQRVFPKLKLLLLVLCAELLVLSFFQRAFIALGFLIYEFLFNFRSFQQKDIRFYIWLLLILAISIFPILPPSVGYKNDLFVIIGMLMTLARFIFIIKTRLDLRNKTIALIGMTNAMFCIYQHSQQMGLNIISQIISWCFLLYSLIASANPNAITLKHRLENILFHFSSIYNLLCTSYESIFLLMLISALLISLSTQQNLLNAAQELSINNTRQRVQTIFRMAFGILLYTFLSFFGTGNIASLSSFDPNIIRCFLTTFSPFIIMGLVIFKLIIPVILIITIIYGMSHFVRNYETQIFICLLLICDVMGLNFLFLVRNKGSWLDIGTSISHFVIMQVTTLALVLIALLAKLLLRLQTIQNLTMKYGLN